MSFVLILVLGTVLGATRSWRSQEREWFEASALVAAVLLGVLLLAIA
jgi:hypothetical protein